MEVKMGKNREHLFSKFVKLIYALALVGAATLILILFEGVIKLNIYFVYLSAGVILGLSGILFLNIFSKNSEY